MWEKGEGGRIAQTLATGLLLPYDVHAFEEGTEESVGRRLQWHTIAITPFSSITHHSLYFVVVLTSLFVRLLNWPTFWVIVQRILPRKLIGKREAQETAVKTAKEKMKAVKTTKKKAAAAEKNRALAEKRSTELLAKQNEIDVKLAKAINLNTA